MFLPFSFNIHLGLILKYVYLYSKLLSNNLPILWMHNKVYYYYYLYYYYQGWPCPFASSPLATENSTWLRKSASDEFSGEDTNRHTTFPLECRKTLQSLETECCQMMFSIYA